MRKVAAWLVSDCGGEWSDAWEMPVRAFTSRELAEECKRKREERGAGRDGVYGPGWCLVSEIEVVMDD